MLRDAYLTLEALYFVRASLRLALSYSLPSICLLCSLLCVSSISNPRTLSAAQRSLGSSVTFIPNLMPRRSSRLLRSKNIRQVLAFDTQRDKCFTNDTMRNHWQVT